MQTFLLLIALLGTCVFQSDALQLKVKVFSDDDEDLTEAQRRKKAELQRSVRHIRLVDDLPWRQRITHKAREAFAEWSETFSDEPSNRSRGMFVLFTISAVLFVGTMLALMVLMGVLVEEKFGEQNFRVLT